MNFCVLYYKIYAMNFSFSDYIKGIPLKIQNNKSSDTRYNFIKILNKKWM